MESSPTNHNKSNYVVQKKQKKTEKRKELKNSKGSMQSGVNTGSQKPAVSKWYTKKVWKQRGK